MNETEQALPPDLPGFVDRELLRLTPNTALFRAREVATGRTVLVEVPAGRSPSPLGSAMIVNQAAIARGLSGHGLPCLLDARNLNDRPAVIMADVDGVLLARWLSQRAEAPSDAQWLDLLLQIARALEAVHAAEIIHKDLNPAGILISEHTEQITLMDFGLASEMPRELQEAVPVGSLLGTLAYMAPEQTGRMSRGIDQRSDLYALGAVAFELACGRPPFISVDPLELVHSQLARAPDFPAPVERERPWWMLGIVRKLLAKDPAQRYQTAAGLAADLSRIQRELGRGQAAEPFELDCRSRGARLRVPDRLYGREGELERLASALDAVSAGALRYAYVHGASGIGKTVLVEELRIPLAGRRGLVVQGKFEQYELDVPYAGLGRALRSLLHWLVRLSSEEFKALRRRLHTALGNEARALLEIEPALVRLLPDDLDPLPEVPGPEARRRHERVFQRFCSILCRPDRPLVVFLDDLQWADGGSVRLLASLADSDSISGMLVVLAARSDELPPGHPLPAALDGLIRSGAALDDIAVGPLAVRDFQALLADALGDPEAADALAGPFHEHTAGNPYQLRAALGMLRDLDIIAFDEGEARWRVDLRAAENALGSDLLERHVRRRVDALGPRGRDILASASVLGSRFTLGQVSAVTGNSYRESMESLREASRQGLVDRVQGLRDEQLPDGLGGAAADAADASPARDGSVSFIFRHDRLQRAAYGLLDDQERTRLHWQIGHLLLDGASEENLDERVMTVVGHLNLARDLAEYEHQRVDLARLNARAARRAHRSGAYRTALRCAQLGLELLGPGCWLDWPSLALNLSTALAEAAALTGELETLEQAASAVQVHADRPRDRVRAQRALVHGYAIQGRMEEAIEACRDGLAWFGVDMPREPTQAQVGEAFIEANAAIGERDPSQLAELPSMSDPDELAVLELYETLIAVAYIVAPTLFAWMILTAVTRSVRSGNPPSAAFFYACMGLIVMAGTRDVERTARFGALGLALAEQTPARGVRGRALFLVGSALAHWTRDLARGAELLVISRRLLMEAGDLEFAGYASYNIAQQRLLGGVALGELATPFEEELAELEALKLTTARRWLAVLVQFVACLRSESVPEAGLCGLHFDPAVELPAMAQAQDHTALAIFHINALLLNLLCGRPDAAREHALAAREVHHGLAEFPAGAVYPYLETCALLYPVPGGEAVAARDLDRARAHRDLLRVFAGGNQDLYGPKLRTVEGLLAFAEGDVAAAVASLDVARGQAMDAGLPHVAGLASNLAAACAAASDDAGLAGRFRASAQDAFRSWGARALVRREVAAAGGESELVPADAGIRQLDLLSLLKASQVLGSELRIEELPDRLLDVILENAGATVGALVYRRNDRWWVRLRGLAGDSAASDPVPLEEAEGLPLAVVNEVLNTGEPVVPGDGEAFGGPAGKALTGRSIACLPLQYGERLLGAIYLANDLLAGLFSAERLDPLKVLCGQAAIALQNALLYSELEDSERRLRAILDHNIDLITMIDGEGYFVFVSPSAERMLGYRPEEMLGTSVLDYVHPDDLAQHRELLGRLVSEPGREEKVLTRYRHRDGSWRHIETEATNHLESPGVGGILINTRDVTDRLEAEERLRRGQRLEAIGQLTGGVAHDFNNLLMVILGSLELMVEGLEPGSEIRPLAEEAMRAADRGATLTGSLLAFSRRQPLQPTVVDLEQVLDDLKDLLRRTLPEHTRLEVHAGADTPCCHVDAGQLQNAILNLVVNARDAMPDGGGLVLRTGSVEIDGERAAVERIEAGPYASLTVQDTGTGMSAETAARAFEPFFTTKEVGHGTGLGLSMVFGFARQSGGTVLLESHEGDGTTVTLLLPASAQRPVERTRDDGVSARIQGETVLVLEDDAEVRQVTAAMVRSLGYGVCEAESAEAAEALLESHPDIGLVLSDIVLAGGRSGLDLAVELRRHRPRLGVALMSGYAQGAQLRARAELDDVPLLDKPFTRQQLSETLRALAAGGP